MNKKNLLPKSQQQTVVRPSLQQAGKMVASLTNLRRDRTYCDVFLQVEEKQVASEAMGEVGNDTRGVWAHSIVLAAVSPYFYDRCKRSFNKGTKQVIFINDVTLGTLQELVENIYSATTLLVSVEKATELLAAATSLEVYEVRDEACECLKRALSADNALGIHASAVRHGCTVLAATATHYIYGHFQQVLEADELLALESDSLIALLNTNRLAAAKESAFDAVLRWMLHHPQDVNLKTLRKRVEYIYSATSLVLSVKKAKELLAAATSLKVAEVSDMACGYMLRALSADNALGVHTCAVMYNCTALAAAATKYIQNHFERVLQAEELLALEPDSMKALLNANQLAATNKSVFDAALRWMQHRPQERWHHLAALLSPVPRQILRNDEMQIVEEPTIDPVPRDARARDTLHVLPTTDSEPSSSSTQEMQAGLGWAKKKGANTLNMPGQSLAEIQAEARKQQAAAVAGAAAAAANQALEEAQAAQQAQINLVPWGNTHNGGFGDTQPNAIPKPIEKPQEPIKAPELKAKKKPTAIIATKKESSPAVEFEAWCTTVLASFSSKIDVPTFVGFLKDIESPYEVKDYVKCYLGESKDSGDFARQFLERRSKLLRVGMVTPSDDLCSPAMAVNPRTISGSDYQEVKDRQQHLGAAALQHVRSARIPHEVLAKRAYAEPLASAEGTVQRLVEAFNSRLHRPERRALPAADSPRRPRASALLVVGGWKKNAGPTRDVRAYELSSGRWQSVAALPEARWVAGVTMIDDNVYVVGGRDGGRSQSSVFVFDVSRGSWTAGPSLCSARWALAVAALGGRLYAAGGRDSKNADLSSVEALDPREGVWRPVARMAAARAGVGAATVDGRLYVAGGYDGRVALNTVERYDPSADRWEPAESIAQRRSWHGVVAVDDTLYVVGGGDGSTRLRSVERYRVGSRWEPAPSMTAARSSAAVTTHAGRVYVAGGDGEHGPTLCSVAVFDPATAAWSELPAAMPEGRVGAVAVVVDWPPPAP